MQAPEYFEREAWLVQACLLTKVFQECPTYGRAPLAFGRPNQGIGKVVVKAGLPPSALCFKSQFWGLTFSPIGVKTPIKKNELYRNDSGWYIGRSRIN